MIVLLLVIQALLCSMLLYNEFVLRRGANLATCLFYLVYSIVYVLVPIILHLMFGGARSIVSGQANLFHDSEVYVFFNICGITLLLCSLLISILRKSHLPRATRSRYPLAYDHAVAALIILGLFVFIYSSQLTFADLLVASRFAWTTDDPTFVALGVLAVYLIALTSFYIYRFRTSATPRRAELACCLIAVVLYGIVTKDRKCFFYVVSGLIAARYVRHGCRLYIRPRHAVVGVLLFSVLFVSGFARDALPKYFMGQDVQLIPELQFWLGECFQFGDLSYFYRATIEAIDQNMNNDYFVPLALLRRIVFFPLPTSYSAGLKVEDISAIFSDVVGGEDALRRGSMPPGLFGLFVISFGIVGTIALIPVLAFFISWLDRLFRERNGLFRDVVLSQYFVGVVYAFRGDESTAFYLPVVNGCGLLFLLLFMKAWRRQKSRDDFLWRK